MKRPFKMTSDRPQGAILRLRPSAMPADRSESVDAVRGEWTWRGIVNMSRLDLSNMMVYMPDPMRPCRAIDLRRVMSVEMSNVRAVAFGEAVLRGASYPYDVHTPPHEECIGITMTDGSNSVPANYVNVRALGFGQGIQVGGEHVVMINCCAAFGRYGFTFGNYPYYCAFNHPITMINCCDEQNVNMPLFASCGDDGGEQHGLQEVTMISFNFERVAKRVPGGKLGDLMRETRPGTWRGQIGFITQPDWHAVNSVDLPLWAEDGSGNGFRTINNAQKSACTSAERRSYYPQYMQQIFDLDLNKLLICTDPAKRKWVDALGNECP
jgi:hypothetical protein